MAAAPPSFYFIVSPDPATSFAQDGVGPHYFIKFGDGDMILPNHRYSTHNPSYQPSVCLNCDGPGSYVYTNPLTNVQSNDRIGKFLQKTLFPAVNPGVGGGLQQIGATEWYRIRPPVGAGIGALQLWLTNFLIGFPNEHFEAGLNTSTQTATAWVAAAAANMNAAGFR